MEKRIEIKGEGTETLTSEHFQFLLTKYGLAQNFKVTAYEPVKDVRRRGIVTVTGDGDFSQVYTALTNEGNFSIVGINTEKVKGLEDKLRDALGGAQ